MFDFDKATVPLNEAKAAFLSAIKAWGENDSYISKCVEFRRTFYGVIIQPSASYDEAAGVYKYHVFLLLREPHGLEETRADFWRMAQQYQNPDQRYVNKGFMGFWKEWGRLLGSDCRIKKAFGEIDPVYDLARVFFCSPWEPDFVRVRTYDEVLRDRIMSVEACAGEVSYEPTLQDENSSPEGSSPEGEEAECRQANCRQAECCPGLNDDCTDLEVELERGMREIGWESRASFDPGLNFGNRFYNRYIYR
jgi:hypothetical protein